MSALLNPGMFVVPKEPTPTVEPTPDPGLLTAESAREEADRVTALVVSTPQEYDLAAAEMVRLKTLIKEAKARFDPICQKAHEAHEEACKQRAIVIEPLTRACSELDPKLTAYLLRVKKEAEEAQQREFELAQQQAAEAREEEIECAETLGASAEEVASLIKRPLDVMPVIASRTAPRGAVGLRENYKGCVTNLALLVTHVAANPQHLNLLCANQAAIDQLAKALKTAMRIPGIEVVNAAGTSTRTGPRRGARS